MSGKFVISLDFEKYWGVRDHKDILDYKDNLKNVDEVIISLLNKFNKYDIHATWGIVGFLFHRDKQELVEKMPATIEFYTDKKLNPYLYLKNKELDAQFHFAADIINEIASTSNQEIASHTYSHYYCLENGQNEKDFEEDLRLFLSVCNNKGYDVSTIIFPRNQINNDYIPILNQYGISAYRGNEIHPIYKAATNNDNTMVKRGLRFIDRYINITGHKTYSLERNCKIYNVRSSSFLAPYIKKLKMLEFLRIRRIKNSMTYAAKNNEIYHLWWHPHNFGSNTLENITVLEEILNHFMYLSQRYGMKSRNISDIVGELNQYEDSYVSR